MILKKNSVRFKSLRNKKRFPCCDWHGICKNKAYAEVYPCFLNGKKHENNGWSYLCKKHYSQEQKKFKGKLPYSLKIEW